MLQRPKTYVLYIPGARSENDVNTGESVVLAFFFSLPPYNNLLFFSFELLKRAGVCSSFRFIL